ncbi:energy transducer TonB [Filimonas effusa]|uniref:Energy transducer TonB n=1 Tax=Filimonas effusa TaxID=2508721 RepID=A0A4Q1D5Y1_9BACT|nr:energy transducer TonB [Filimonas effusa]RXK83283.1 energy transducer TonB [Filimonas effusa]
MFSKPIRTILIVLMVMPLAVIAQKETTYVYYNALWKPTIKDSAAFYTKLYWQGQLLHKELYRADSSVLLMSGSYLDSAATIEQGYVKRYRGRALRDSILFEKGERREGWFFYPSGHKRAYFHTTAPGKYDVQRGWDEDGKEITPFVVFQPASFPGGDSAWKAYLMQGLATGQPVEYTQGKISGKVLVMFSILPDGAVGDVHVRTSSGQDALDKHAIEVIKNSPRWNPAIQFNKKVRFFQKQELTYAKMENKE